MTDSTVRQVSGATRRDIIAFVSDNLRKNGWKTSFNYTVQRPQKFFQKPLIIAPGSRSDFIKFIDYCFLLSNTFDSSDEAARYEDRNGTSIYFSVLLYWLLTNYGVVDQNKLNLCQGYFSYEVKDHETSETKYRAGVHAWLSYSGSVIDVTIWQQNAVFDFAPKNTKRPLIIGNIPQGLSLVGFEEDKRLVKEYGRQFARDSKLTFYDWVEYHKKQADLLFAGNTDAPDDKLLQASAP